MIKNVTYAHHKDHHFHKVDINYDDGLSNKQGEYLMYFLNFLLHHLLQIKFTKRCYEPCIHLSLTINSRFLKDSFIL